MSDQERSTAGVDAPLRERSIPVVSAAAGFVNGVFEWFGNLGLFAWNAAKAVCTPPYEWGELVRQLDEVGSKSLPLVALAGSAIGAVLAMQTRSSLARFGAKSLLPSAIVYTVVREMGPIITSLVVSGRVGAGIGAELASMKVSEQIDAVEVSGVSPYRFLAAPRILACILMMPLLTLAADALGGHMSRVARLGLFIVATFVGELRATAVFARGGSEAIGPAAG